MLTRLGEITFEVPQDSGDNYLDTRG